MHCISSTDTTDSQHTGPYQAFCIICTNFTALVLSQEKLTQLPTYSHTYRQTRTNTLSERQRERKERERERETERALL